MEKLKLKISVNRMIEGEVEAHVAAWRLGFYMPMGEALENFGGESVWLSARGLKGGDTFASWPRGLFYSNLWFCGCVGATDFLKRIVAFPAVFSLHLGVAFLISHLFHVRTLSRVLDALTWSLTLL
jgi:hypothetical protein